MELIFLVGLGLATLRLPAEGAAEGREGVFELDGPIFEDRHLAWEAETTPESGPGASEGFSPEIGWLPRPSLRYEDEGGPGGQRRTSLLLLADRTPQEDQEGRSLPSPSTAEAFRWREAGLPGRSPLWFLLNSLDLLVGLDHIHVSVDKGASEVSVSTKVSSLLESLGTPLDRSLFLGVNIDLLGFDEGGGTRSLLIDTRHGTARPSYLSTGFGLTLKF